MYVLSFFINDRVTFGNNRIQLLTDSHLLASLAVAIDRDPEVGADIREHRRLLRILLKDETFRVHTWLSPLGNEASIGPATVEEGQWPAVVKAAWKVDPYLAVHLSGRCTSQAMMKEVRRLIMANPEDVIEAPVAAQILLGDSLSPDLRFQLKVRAFIAC
jgi:phosphatidylinositol 4-kinase